MTTPVHKLILHSQDPNSFVAEPVALIETLRQQGLCADAFDFNGGTHYRVGSQFLSLISFLGCSPSVDTSPEENNSAGGFCHIELAAELAQISFLGGDNVKPPRCPHCRRQVTEWRALITTWQRSGDGSEWQCPQCGHKCVIPQLDWREYGGFGRCYLAVWGVAEGLAVPSDQLLELLKQETGFDWRFFYFTHKG